MSPFFSGSKEKKIKKRGVSGAIYRQQIYKLLTNALDGNNGRWVHFKKND